MPDLYAELGVPPTADAKAIRRAYRRRAKSAHPDHGGTVEKFGALKRAHDILTDPDRRAKYDSTGDASEKEIDNRLGVLMQIVSGALDQAMMACIQRGEPITEAPLIQGMLGAITDLQRQQREAMTNHRKAIEQNKLLRGRFTAKGGENIIDKMLEHRIAGAEAVLSTMDRRVGELEAAKELIRRHEFRTDPRSDRMRDHTFNNGTTMFFEAFGR